MNDAQKPAAALDGLSPEIFDSITGCLSRQDKFRLCRVSKALFFLTEPSLYTSVDLKRGAPVDQIARKFATVPRLCGAVRLYRLHGCIDDRRSVDLIDQFTGLWGFNFEHASRSNQETAARLVKLLSTRDWNANPSLQKCLINIFYSDDDIITVEVMDKLLLELLSVPFIRELYLQSQQIYNLSGEAGYIIPTLPSAQFRPLPELSETKYTNLQKLVLSWDGLPLSHLRSLLELPRQLKTLVLKPSLLYIRLNPLSDIPLDEALEPVADTLRKLQIFPRRIFGHPDAEESDLIHMQTVDLPWTKKGLRKFRQITTLGIRASVFLDCTIPEGQLMVHSSGSRPGAFRLPDSLEKLELNDGYLYLAPQREGRPLACRIRFEDMEDPSNVGAWLEEISEAVARCPNLRLICVKIDDPKIWDDEILRSKPPVQLPHSAGYLHTRGIKIGVVLDFGLFREEEVLVLETRVIADYY